MTTVSEFNFDRQTGKAYIEYDNGTGVSKDLTQAVTGVLNTDTGIASLDNTSRAMVASGTFVKQTGLIAATWGDSLVANGWTANGATTGMNMLAVADAYAGGVFKRIINGGVSGERTDAAILRLDSILANNPDVFIIGPCSVNDIDQAKGTILTPEQTISNYEVAFAKAFATPSVKQVWVMTVHRPASTLIATVSSTGDQVRSWYDSLETYVRNKAASDPRIKIIEFSRAVGNDLGTSLVTNYNATASDTTHIGYLGAQVAATNSVRAVMLALPFNAWDMPQHANNFRNLMGPCASALQGSFASGAGGVSFGTGVTGTAAPGGIVVRRNSGDSTATITNVNSITSPVGLPGKSITMDYTIGAAGGGGGAQFGAVGNIGNYDNTRTNSTAYTHGSRINISSTLCAQCLIPGTSAASSPSFASAAVGNLITDGTVTWIVTEIPQMGDWLLFEADASLTANTGGANVMVWINFTDTSGNQAASWINVSNATNQLAWPTATGRVLLRNYIQVPTLAGAAIRSVTMLVGVQGANGSTGTLQVHRASFKRSV